MTSRKTRLPQSAREPHSDRVSANKHSQTNSHSSIASPLVISKSRPTNGSTAHPGPPNRHRHPPSSAFRMGCQSHAKEVSHGTGRRIQIFSFRSNVTSLHSRPPAVTRDKGGKRYSLKALRNRLNCETFVSAVLNCYFSTYYVASLTHWSIT